MTRLLGGASMIALVLALGAGLSAPALADGDDNGGGAKIEDLAIGTNCEGCAISVEAGEIEAGTIATNVLEQDIKNEVKSDDDVVDWDAEYKADHEFGVMTFEEQKVNVNNFNTGINSAQQGAIAIAADLANAGAVSANVLKQTVANKVDADDVVQGTYYGEMEFGCHTFQHQKVNVNNFNSGINSAQQGGIAIAVNTDGFHHNGD